MKKMNFEYEILLYGIIAVTVLDSLGSVLSRTMNFEYSYLGIFTILIYGWVANRIAIYCDVKKAVWGTGLLGLYDATIGWWVSETLNANITFKEIQSIKKVLKHKLANIYHLRIEYPE